jgi:hypothetical protein
VVSFGVECFQNEYLTVGAGDVNAILTVTASGTGGPPPAHQESPAAVVMLIDVSGSMDGAKIREARKAIMTALDCVPDGVRFAVVAGNQLPVPVYPQHGLAGASTRSRTEAKEQVARLQAGGGTRIGTWLTAATDLLEGESGVRQAILLTDGKNEGETAQDLERALADASGIFQCDCRGVGTDWSVRELTQISDALMGTKDIVADPAHLGADFEQMMTQAMRKGVADVQLRIWTPKGAEIAFIKQVSPTLRELSPVQADTPQAFDFPLGSWGDESRDYHLLVRIHPAEPGDEMLAARVSLLVGGEVSAHALVRATWTDDTALSTRINRQVAHYTGQQEMAQAIQDGLDARSRGDEGTAIVRLGRAVELAAASGNTEMSDLLSKVVDVDPATGRVRLKQQVEKADEMTLETRSTRTARVRR